MTQLWRREREQLAGLWGRTLWRGTQMASLEGVKRAAKIEAARNLVKTKLPVWWGGWRARSAEERADGRAVLSFVLVLDGGVSLLHCWAPYGPRSKAGLGLWVTGWEGMKECPWRRTLSAWAVDVLVSIGRWELVEMMTVRPPQKSLLP